ncbi:NADH-quinone oxidoreductase subunit NuoE [Rhodococcus sp. 14-2470-1a]|uniref:NADH-quinone oxidoreductase subunit NuoE n=1 Tax=Rhodococcus sp. 14-2470-1a TaxID=2023150 RepID=UPI000B9C66CE|nr:NADH-quinone oxidoreductase subunit NuoE [Rhodococcus sp. 14-2470-1a]OZF44180.1 NADH-quinone oxidoreductase subunit E [Rhodococcus sp. 14-2470-1a]
MSEKVHLRLRTRPAPYPDDVRVRLDEDARAIIARYSPPDAPNPAMARSALLPLLHLVQSQDGYVSPTGIEFCAEHLGLTGAEVTAVSSFYSMYRREPTGDYLVGVCTNTLCAVMGGDAIMDALREHVDPADPAVTLTHVECNAACDYAPVVMVNWEFFDNQTPESARALVDSLRSDTEVVPTRGASLCTFQETERILAGFPDQRLGAVHAGGRAGASTLAGLRFAREHGMNAPTADEVRDSGAAPLGSEQANAAETTKDKPAPAPTESVPPEKGP